MSNNVISKETVISVFKYYLNNNKEGKATEDFVVSIGATLLGVSDTTMKEMLFYNSSEKTIKLPKILGATLLSAEEAETLLSKEERAYNNWWWLRTPGNYSAYACDVNYYGGVNDIGHLVYNYSSGVRPALNIDASASNITVGDVFMFGGKEFKVLSPKLAWMHKDDIGNCAFRQDWKAEDANNYEASDVKKFVDAWFDNALEEATSVE